jgi:hypothetical protein
MTGNVNFLQTCKAGKIRLQVKYEFFVWKTRYEFLLWGTSYEFLTTKNNHQQNSTRKPSRSPL